MAKVKGISRPAPLSEISYTPGMSGDVKGFPPKMPVNKKESIASVKIDTSNNSSLKIDTSNNSVFEKKKEEGQDNFISRSMNVAGT